MRKTITINIRGIVFHIDDNAYEKLKSYLSSISSHFEKQEGGREITEDIEARIAEIFSTHITQEYNVIDEKLVDHVIATMGMPEDFQETETDNQSNGTTTNENPNASNYNTYYQSSKRLYRDGESKVIAGVCSGLAYYLNIDKAVIRIIFVILFFVTSGIALPVYLILWIAVPKASSTTQRLEMQREPITVDNIGRKVKEDINEKKNDNKVKTSRPDAAQQNMNQRTEGPSVLSKIFGVLLILFGLFSSLLLIAGIVGATKLIGFAPGFAPAFDGGIVLSHIFSESLGTTVIISLLVLLIIPLLLIIYTGTRLLFNFDSNSRSVYLSSLGVWFIAFLILGASISGVASLFNSKETVLDNQKLTISADTLFVKVNQSAFDDYESKFAINNYQILSKNKREMVTGTPRLNIEKSESGGLSIEIGKTSKGNNSNNAQANAEKIQYPIEISGDTIILYPSFLLPENGKWRMQELTTTIKLTEGKIVFLDNSTLSILEEIKNTSFIWYGDMTDQYWIMEPNGLTLYK
jgi:phage shock protein PspC (stress-responsive transcriptional regulator)